MANDNLKLQARYGYIGKFTFGTLISGDDVTALPVGEYVVASVASTGSGLGLSTPVTGIKITVQDGETITPATGDSLYPITVTKMCEVTGGSFDISADEQDATTLCDAHDVGFRVYEKGLQDMTGTLDGLSRATDVITAGGINNKFFLIATQSADGLSTEVKPVSEGALYLDIVTNSASKQGEPTSGYLMPVELFSTNITMTTGEMQTFTTSVRPTSDDKVKVHMYSRLSA